MEDRIDIDSPEIKRIMRETLKPLHATDPYILRFIEHYLHCRNTNQAARLAGLSIADGRNLFGRADIYKCIQKITEEAVVKFGYDAAEVVERVKELAFVDIADLFDDEGRIIENIRDMAPEIRRAIKKFKYKSYFENDVNGVPQYRGRIYEVEMWDKPKSLELLAREKDTFKKTTVVEHDVSKNAAAFLLGSVERANQRKLELVRDVPVLDVTPVKETGFAPPPSMAFSKPPGVK